MKVLAPLLLAILMGCAAQPRIRSFTTDGCTLFPDGTSEHKNLWLDCCKEHDYRYWMGGTKEQRLSADIRLRECVAAVGRPKTAELMFEGVRAGGIPYLPAPWRWGYGWPYLRGYKPLTEEEIKLIEDTQW